MENKEINEHSGSLEWNEGQNSNLFEYIMIGIFTVMIPIVIIMGVWYASFFLLLVIGILLFWLKLHKFKIRSSTGFMHTNRRMNTGSIIDIFNKMEKKYGLPAAYGLKKRDLFFTFTKNKKPKVFHYIPVKYELIALRSDEEILPIIDDVCKEHEIFNTGMSLTPEILDLDRIRQHIWDRIDEKGLEPTGKNKDWKRSSVVIYDLTLMMIVVSFFTSLMMFIIGIFPSIEFVPPITAIITGVISAIGLFLLVVYYLNNKIWADFTVNYPNRYRIEKDGIHLSHYKEGYNELLRWDDINDIRGIGLPFIIEVVPPDDHDWGPVVTESWFEKTAYRFIVFPRERERIFEFYELEKGAQ